MAQFIPIATWGLTVAPNGAPEQAFDPETEPGTLQLTMATIDPGEDISQNQGVEEFKKPRATVKMLVIKDPDDESDDLDEDMNMVDLVGEESGGESSDDENGEGPSDPDKSPKAMRKAAMIKLLEEDEDDVLANGKKSNAKGKGKADHDIEMDEESQDGEALPGTTQTLVLCTLDPENHFNQPLNITIPRHEIVAFRVEGTHSIHLSGNIVINPAEEATFGSETSDSEEEDEDVNLTPDEDELELQAESESDELDDMEDPRITEVSSDDGEEREASPKVKAKTEPGVKNPSIPQETEGASKVAQSAKGKNKRPAEDSLIEEKDDEKPSADTVLDKALKKEEQKPEGPLVNGEEPLSKNQLKKMRKKMKDNAGNAVQIKQEKHDDDEGEKLTTETSKETPGGKTKQVQFAEKLVQGPGVNGTGSNSEKNPKSNQVAKSDGKPTKGGNKLPNPRTVDGVSIDDKKIGSGPQVKKGDRVSTRYIGKTEDKRVFDANKKGAPYSFKVGIGQVVKGMDIGVLGMSVGGERRIIIPPHLGYGNKAQKDGTIPPNSTLIFDMKLIEIK